MSANSEELTAVALGMTQALTLWTALAPNIDDVRCSSPSDADMTDRLRTAEMVVGGMAVLVGTISALHMHSLMPLAATGVTVLGIIAAYELTLRKQPSY